MAKSTRSYEERMLDMEKKKQESIEKAKRYYALFHQKKVEVPVEKPVLYERCGNCNRTAYLKAKEKYDKHMEKLAGRYKAKTAMYETFMILLAWYSVSTTIFQMIQTKVFISDCVTFLDTITAFVKNVAGWVIPAGKKATQISRNIPNPAIANIAYWLIRILIYGFFLTCAGILVAFIGRKIAGLYQKYCMDMITVMTALISIAVAIYFGEWIKAALPINLLFLLLVIQTAYVGIRWYVKGWREARGYY